MSFAEKRYETGLKINVYSVVQYIEKIEIINTRVKKCASLRLDGVKEEIQIPPVEIPQNANSQKLLVEPIGFDKIRDVKIRNKINQETNIRQDERLPILEYKMRVLQNIYRLENECGSFEIIHDLR